MEKRKISGSRISFIICLMASIVMLVAGFIVPPTGIIDGSVLTAVGELFGFATLATLPSIVHGRNVRMTHGNTTIDVSEEDKNKTE